MLQMQQKEDTRVEIKSWCLLAELMKWILPPIYFQFDGRILPRDFEQYTAGIIILKVCCGAGLLYINNIIKNFLGT